MSDSSQGPGWWRSPEGRWYPPESQPAPPGWWQAADGRWYPPQSQTPPPGWWLASDGRWYPPQQRQPAPPGWWLAQDGRWYPPRTAQHRPSQPIVAPWHRRTWTAFRAWPTVGQALSWVGVGLVGLLALSAIAGPAEDGAGEDLAAVVVTTIEPFETTSTRPPETSAPTTTQPAPTTTADPLASLTPEERDQLDAFLNPPPPTTTTTPPPAPLAPAAGCDPNYSGCVPIASDVDCAGGSGNGPAYTGYTTVIGSDIYDLDSDGDGSACES
jgi:hypothetical protein